MNRCYTIHVTAALYDAIADHALRLGVSRKALVIGELSYLLTESPRATSYPKHPHGGDRRVPNAPRCNAILNDGNPCRRHATKGDLCGHHFALQVLDERGAKAPRKPAKAREAAPAPVAHPMPPSPRVAPFVAPRRREVIPILEGRDVPAGRPEPRPARVVEERTAGFGGLVTW